jgi:hypothetical protein
MKDKRMDMELNRMDINVELNVMLNIEAPIGCGRRQIDNELNNIRVTCEMKNGSNCEIMDYGMEDFHYELPDIIKEILEKMNRSYNQKNIDMLAELTEQLQYVLDKKNEL